MAIETKNLKAQAAALQDIWSPRVVGTVGDHFVKVAKLEGEFVWHEHEGEDEMFLVLQGSLRIEFLGQDAVTLEEGDFTIVPKGVRHKPVAEAECLVALFEPAQTAHTGAEETALTRSIEEQIRS